MMSQQELEYYNLFLQNAIQGNIYCIELIDGTILKGAPKVGSMISTTFFMQLNNSTKEIPLNAIKNVKKIK